MPASHSFTSGLGDVVLYLVLTILALMKVRKFSYSDYSPPLLICYWYFRHFTVYKYLFQQLV